MEDNVFKIMFEAQANSPSMRAVWREAYQDDYPENADPLSFITKSDLRQMIEALGLSAGEDLVDVGCGAGGPGSHVALATGARLTGIDSSTAALELARGRHLGTLPIGSRFQQGDFASTGLPGCFADGVMSSDALLFAADPGAVFRELARVTKPSGRLVFTSFELRTRSPVLSAGPILDYRPFMESAGFSVELYEESPNWESRMRTVFSSILDRRDQLSRELGEPAGSITIAWATVRPHELPDSRRIFAVAQRH